MNEDVIRDLERRLHYLRADDLLTLVFVYGYDIDWYPLLTRLIGNW